MVFIVKRLELSSNGKRITAFGYPINVFCTMTIEYIIILIRSFIIDYYLTGINRLMKNESGRSYKLSRKPFYTFFVKFSYSLFRSFNSIRCNKMLSLYISLCTTIVNNSSHTTI